MPRGSRRKQDDRCHQQRHFAQHRRRQEAAERVDRAEQAGGR